MSKPASKSSTTSLDAITRDVLPETRAILSELTAVIRRTAPQVTEKVNLGHRGLSFRHPDVGHFCGLFPREDRVVAEFEFGVLLPDPHGLFSGNECAKQKRYARFRSLRALPRAAFQGLVRAAISLPPEHSVRVALTKSGARPVPPPSRPKKRPLPRRPLR